MKLIVAIFLTAFLIQCSGSGEAQKASFNIDETLLKGSFTFYAEMAYPMRMRTRALNPPDQLTVKGDTLTSSLSYFGQAQTVMQNHPGGVTFETTEFTRSVSKNEKGEWMVIFEFQNEASAQQIIMTIYDNAQAMVTVTSLRRDRIQYRGYIRPGRG